jgi:hypothetical protein
MNAVTSSRLGRHWLVILAVLAVLAAVALGSAAPRAAADSPQTAVLDWNKHANDALFNAPNFVVPGTDPPVPLPGAGQTPPVGALHWQWFTVRSMTPSTQ